MSPRASQTMDLSLRMNDMFLGHVSNVWPCWDVSIVGIVDIGR